MPMTMSAPQRGTGGKGCGCSIASCAMIPTSIILVSVILLVFLLVNSESSVMMTPNHGWASADRVSLVSEANMLRTNSRYSATPHCRTRSRNNCSRVSSESVSSTTQSSKMSIGFSEAPRQPEAQHSKLMVGHRDAPGTPTLQKRPETFNLRSMISGFSVLFLLGGTLDCEITDGRQCSCMHHSLLMYQSSSLSKASPELSRMIARAQQLYSPVIFGIKAFRAASFVFSWSS
mmetsp:Transcript_52532/g.137766  ORF Transcript_52532/g.137766 Transcript_52532/m.137766 type:complete len:232 (-) Transcript_52532:1567-2262(-)